MGFNLDLFYLNLSEAALLDDCLADTVTQHMMSDCFLEENPLGQINNASPSLQPPSSFIITSYN